MTVCESSRCYNVMFLVGPRIQIGNVRTQIFVQHPLTTTFNLKQRHGWEPCDSPVHEPNRGWYEPPPAICLVYRSDYGADLLCASQGLRGRRQRHAMKIATCSGTTTTKLNNSFAVVEEVFPQDVPVPLFQVAREQTRRTAR
jgi:hypothetical protein